VFLVQAATLGWESGSLASLAVTNRVVNLRSSLVRDILRQSQHLEDEVLTSFAGFADIPVKL